MSRDAVVSVSHLAKAYGPTVAVADISLAPFGPGLRRLYRTLD
jgi:hypothetical protein